MDVNSDAGSGSILKLEGVPMMEEQGEFALPTNVPVIDYSFPSIMEQPSSRNLSFVQHNPTSSMFNHPNPDNPVATMFFPTAFVLGNQSRQSYI